MGANTSIQWTNATVNFWTGCKKVSAGCKYCYMFRDQIKFGRDPENIVRTSPKTFNAALKWVEPKMIFTCSWSDFFIEDADDWRNDAWDVIRKTPQHTWQILTKRPERINDCLPPDWGNGWKNVWLGVTVENQNSLQRMYDLLNVPAHVRFISAEPLLELVHLNESFPVGKGEINMLPLFDWVIVGGESGNENGEFKYRQCAPLWMTRIVDDCKEFDVPVFVKQMGTYLSHVHHMKDRHGGNIDEFPESLKIRQMPNAYWLE